MAIDIRKYTTFSTHIQAGIFHYMRDFADRYAISADADDETCRQVLHNLIGACQADTSLKKTTKAFVRNMASKAPSRSNLRRICFALKLNDREATDLFVRYLNINEPSARNLEEFIFLSCLKVGASLGKYDEMLTRYKEAINAQQMAPSNLTEGATHEVYLSVIGKLHTLADMEAFLNRPDQLRFFRKTRNTSYLAFFDDIRNEHHKITGWSEEKEKEINIDDYPNMKENYEELYSIRSLDRVPKDHSCLTEEQILTLQKYFGDAFITYDTYCAAFQRRRGEELASELYLLRLLETLVPSDISADDINRTDINDVDFSCREELFEVLNTLMDDAGFSSFEEGTLNPFFSLVIECYDEVMAIHPGADSAKVQIALLDELYKALVQIASLA